MKKKCEPQSWVHSDFRSHKGCWKRACVLFSVVIFFVCAPVPVRAVPSIIKSTTKTYVSVGDVVTYTLGADNTSNAVAYSQDFSAGIPSGWTYPTTVPGVNWTASAGFLQQTATGITGYPQILASDMTPVHDGIFQADMMISDLDTGHFDALMMIDRVDANNFYAIRINANSCGAGKTTSDMYIDTFVGGVSKIPDKTVVNPHGLNIQCDTWYTVKTQVCGTTILVKIWPRGDTEPSGWDLNTTVSAVAGNGYVGFQANEGPVAYDNLKVYSLGATDNNVIVTDTIPADITYGGSTCSMAKSGSLLTWNVGAISACAYPPPSCQWWGTVASTASSAVTAEIIKNTAAIRSNEVPAPSTSSASLTVVGCASTPKLDLKIQETTCTGSSRVWAFRVFNNSAIAVTLSDLCLKYWVYEAGATVNPGGANGGPVSGGGAYLYGSSAPSHTAAAVGPCTSPSTRMANWEMKVCGTGTSIIPAGGSWDIPYVPYNRTDWATIDSTDDYSQMPTGQSACGGTAFYDDSHFVLYYQGFPIKEYTSSTTADANTGVPPSCLGDACHLVTVVPTPTRTWTVTSTPTITATRTFTATPTVSNTPTFSPSFTRTSSPTKTFTPTFTPSPTWTFTLSPTPSLTPTRTNTLTNTPTVSPTPSPTASASATRTSSPTNTPTNTPTATRTHTSTPTFTTIFTSTYTSTSTPSRTSTSTSTATQTASATRTSSPTNTQTNTATATPTNTNTSTPTPTSTFSLTSTVTRTNTASPTSTASTTATPTLTASPSTTPTRTSTATATSTSTRTNTETNTATATPSPTNSFTFTPTGWPTSSATSTSSPTSTPTLTATKTPTSTSTATSTPTATQTATNSSTSTPTNTSTNTRTNTTTSTLTSTPTNTPSPTDSFTFTPTGWPTSTWTSTPTVTSTPTASATLTSSPTLTPSSTATPTPTATSTSTAIDTSTYTSTATSTSTFTATSTATASFTDTPTGWPTSTWTNTFTVTNTPTLSFTPTSTWTNTVTNTLTQTWTATPTVTSTDTETPLFTYTVTDTPTVTATDTATFISTDTATATQTLTSTDTPTFTSTSTEVFTPTWTLTFTASATSTKTSTPTPSATFINTQTETLTPTNTPLLPDTFYVSRNVCHPGQDDPPVFVRVRLSTPGFCSVKIYNSAGELVRVLLDEQRQSGTYKDCGWDGKNMDGQTVASGVYIIFYTNRYQTRMAKLLVVR